MGASTFEAVHNASKTRRVSFMRRTDGFYTYIVEELISARTPGYEDDPDDMYWSEVRSGGLFETEAEMREGAEQSPDWPLKMAARIVLSTPKGRQADRFEERLDAFIQAAISGGVKLITCVGPDCEWVHDYIDDSLVGDGSNVVHIMTLWQTDETVEDGLELASQFSELGDTTEVVVV